MILTEYNEELHIRSEKKLSYDQGMTNGERKRAQESILRVLRHRGPISDSLREKIQSENRMDVLEQWLDTAACASTIEEFLEKASK